MKKILLIAPLVDMPTVTSNLAVWDLLTYMDTVPDLDVDYLWGAAANRTALYLSTQRKTYDAIFYFGHGTEKALKGTHIFGNLIDKRNAPRLKDTLVITMACLSGKQLGYDIINAGARSYIGFTDLYYAAFVEKERNFLNDWKQYTLSYFIAILDGCTTGDAHQKFYSEADKYAKLYAKFKKSKNYDWYEKAACHNRDIMCVIGDSKATL